MPGKKSKKKKHKKEEKSSSCSYEDEKEGRNTKSSTAFKSKHKHRPHASSDKDEAKASRTTDLPSTRRFEEKSKKTNDGDRRTTDSPSTGRFEEKRKKTNDRDRSTTDLPSTRRFEEKSKKTNDGDRRTTNLPSTGRFEEKRKKTNGDRRTTDLLSTRRFEEKQKKKNDGDSRTTDMKHNKERSRESKAAENTRSVFKLPSVHEKEHVHSKEKRTSSCKTVATNQINSKELEQKRKELVSRRSASEHHRQTPSKDDCSTKKLQEKSRKRPLSPELHVEPKQKNISNMTSVAHIDHHSDVQNENRKKLVARISKTFDPAVGAQSSQGKTLNTNLPVEKPVGSVSKLKFPEDISPKTQNPVQLGNAPGVISTEKRSCFGCLTAGISFKIPKKASAVKAATNTDVFNANSSNIRTDCSVQPSLSGFTPVKHKVFVSQQHVQKPSEVSAKTPHEPSSVCPPSFESHQVQKVHTDETEATISINASCKEQHTTSQEAAKIFDCDHEMELVEELHLARSERRLDVNVVQNCGELTCMDIDPPEEDASTILNQHHQALLIVLDTNVLLSHLEFVKKIRSHGLGGLGFPTLVIPWVVLQELDYLKSGKLSSKVEDKARPAVHYIYSCLKKQEPRLMGQSMQQASQVVCGPGVVNNDDRVLQCCLQYQALHPEGALVLCTNDKNLCSKALLSGVKALSKTDLQEEVEGSRLTILNHFNAHPATLPSARPVEKEKKKLQTNRQNDAAEQLQLSECVSLLESCLQRALSEVLEEEMKVAFGDLWTEIVYVKPPWSLDGLLQCFKKHWIAVFGSIIKRNLLSCVEMLSDCLCSDRPIECRSVLSAVGLATELLSALAGRSQYNGHVTYALSTLHTLLQRLQSPKAPVESDDADNEDSLMAEVEEDTLPPHLTSHREVWELFESIWNNVCQISSALFSALQYSPGASPQSTSPPPQEALSCLQRLSTALKQLLEALQRLLSPDSSVQDAESLLSFIQTSKIAAMEPRFTAKDLFDCVSQQEYREKLCVGGAQLSELCVNLDHCAAAQSS